MQLSAPTTSADFILATLTAPTSNVGGLLALGFTPMAAPGESAPAAEGDATGFAQLFPALASGQPAAASVGGEPGVADVFANLAPATTGKFADVGSMLAPLSGNPDHLVPKTGTPAIAAGDQPASDETSADEFPPPSLPRPLVATSTGVRGPAAPRSARHLAPARSGIATRGPAEVSSLTPLAPSAPAAFCPEPLSAVVPAEIDPEIEPAAQPDGDEGAASLPMPTWLSPFASDECAFDPLAAPVAPSVTTEDPPQNSPGLSSAPALRRDAALAAEHPIDRVSPSAGRVEPPAPSAVTEFPSLSGPRIAVPAASPSAVEYAPESLAPLARVPASSHWAAEISAPQPATAPCASAPVSDDAMRAVADALVSSGAGRSAIPSHPAGPQPRRNGGANIAALTAKNSGAEIFPHAWSQKTFLTAAAERVANDPADLGIAVANPEPLMPPLASNDRSAPAAGLAPAAPVSALGALGETPASGLPLFAPATPAAAHRAVEAVLNAAERFSTGERHTVNLQFSVGGADLAVRVELRADEVRATFRTDSAELRSALAHEWQAVSADPGGRPFRLAAPVFTSNSADGSGLAAFAGDSAPRQRDASPRRTAGDGLASVASRARAVAPSPAVDVALPAGRLGSLPTSLHLHTLA